MSYCLSTCISLHFVRIETLSFETIRTLCAERTTVRPRSAASEFVYRSRACGTNRSRVCYGIGNCTSRIDSDVVVTVLNFGFYRNPVGASIETVTGRRRRRRVVGAVYVCTTRDAASASSAPTTVVVIVWVFVAKCDRDT